MQETGVITSDDITEEQLETVIERVLDAPFEYDPDVAYYIICENEGFAAANKYYREVKSVMGKNSSILMHSRNVPKPNSMPCVPKKILSTISLSLPT
jgi:hypothetical protein